MANRLAPTNTIKVAAASSVNSQSILDAIAALKPFSAGLNAKSTPAIHLGRCPEFSSSTFLYQWQQPHSFRDLPMSSVRSAVVHTHHGGPQLYRCSSARMLRNFLDEPPTVVWPDNTVWLASYPRSGNTYLRSILWTCFGLQTGSVYRNDLRSDPAVSQQVGHFEGAAHGQFSADFLRLPLVKTHERPVDDRKAIYIVRNGRDCCRSLREFWRAEGHGNVSLDDIIAGHHGFGSWSGHFLAWDPEARPNTLFLRFEQLTQDFEGTLDRLARFLEMRPLHAAPPKLTVARGGGPHWLSPGSTPRGAMTRTQEALFDRLHGDVMARLGYPTTPS
jgi:Sulfotransferase domain